MTNGLYLTIWVSVILLISFGLDDDLARWIGEMGAEVVKGYKEGA